MYSRLRPFRVLENVPRSKIVELLQVQSVQYCRVSVSFENRSLVKAWSIEKFKSPGLPNSNFVRLF